MVTKADVIETERKLTEQLRKVRAAKNGLPLDGSIVETQADVARHYKVERSTIHGWKQKGMPGEPGRYVIADIDAWRAAQVEEEAALASSGDSPSLERWRSWKALEAEIKVKSLLGTYVESDLMRDCWTQVAARLNRLVDQLARLHGRDAETLATDATEDCERILSGVFAARQDAGEAEENVNGDSNDSTDKPARKPCARRVAKPKTPKKTSNNRVGRKRVDPSKRTVQGRKVSAPKAPGEQTVVRGFGQW